MKNVSFVKLQNFYLAKGPWLSSHPPDLQLWYQATCYPAVCVPPLTSHHVRARSRSVWFRYSFCMPGLSQCWWGMADYFTTWLVAPSRPCPGGLFEFLLSMMPCRKSSEIFVPACWCLMAHEKCLVSSLVAFFKELTNQGQSDYSH